VVRTRVGYTGGKKLNPTYYSLGDHTESLQIDYDPEQISYEQLLNIFWDSHNPTRGAWSAQYKAAVFAHNEAQMVLAEASKAQIASEKTGKWFNRKIHTEILPAETFYLAEDYHQKYLLQNTPRLWGDILEIYRDPTGWINSTAAARLNGYTGGYASVAQLAEEIDSLGLSQPAQEYLWQVARRFGK
jgi:peptide-methionine (S)-S-oxide reductase